MTRSCRERKRRGLPGATASRKIIVNFPEPLYEQTQEAVQELSVTRSELIRQAVYEYLRRMERRKLTRELVEGYRANADLNRELSEEFLYVDGSNL